MEFMGKELEDIVVTLPLADGTSMDCGVYSYFEIQNKFIRLTLHTSTVYNIFFTYSIDISLHRTSLKKYLLLHSNSLYASSIK